MNDFTLLQTTIGEYLKTLIRLLELLYNNEGGNLDLIALTEQKIREILESDLGAVVLMDLQHIPHKQGWNIERWLEYIKKHKIIFIDGSNQAQSRVSGFKLPE